jgi:hypothetical protein
MVRLVCLYLCYVFDSIFAHAYFIIGLCALV